MKTLFLFLTMLIITGSSAQDEIVQPPYLRFPELPPLDLLLPDSTTRYTKADLPAKKAVWIVIFNPDCEHCQQSAKEIVEQKDRLKNLHIIMATTATMEKMNAFITNYRLKEVPNLTTGKDHFYILPSFYDTKYLPFSALYDRKARLVTVFEGSVSIKKILSAL